jgi:cytochrome c
MSKFPKLLLAAALLAASVAAIAAPKKPSAATEPQTHVRKTGIGREAAPREIAGWDIGIRPDGKGLPAGRGTVSEGERLYVERCAACHGEFGESAGRWPILSGGAGSLKSHDPIRSVGSYWPYASTLLDYIRRAMPFGAAQSLNNDELYAITAYVLYLNDVITDQNFELSNRNFTSIRLPNQPNFIDDDREIAEKSFWQKQPCMKNCIAGEARITGRARVIDVTPENGKGPKVE